ncbi:Undecaprenyl-phosphate galactosephosphotransferase [hydrothermal vent metagenome]|uniref:Undecaprenyl-phosphate galactosephosphotransferase n=1 Tax=hydrothermal vent metagenome TaxID=652676 RepID=A0A3B1D9G9_9ZZZZ
MKKKRLQSYKIIFTLALLIACIFIGKVSWATLTFIQQDNIRTETSSIQTEINESSPKSKARAPEPASMVLFGGGFIGMVMSFIRKTYAAAKRALDLTLSIIGAIVFSPVMLLTALLVKTTSKGPALYTQIRVGENGRHFKIYKFRSMCVDAESKSGAIWATKNDSRITPIGQFLRKSRLDELPQFLNVIKGEMSLIGPRPERPVFVNQFKKEIIDYEKRLDIKPGITGLAQVWHRYDETIVDVRKKIKYDLLYIKRVCFWTDLRILLRTVLVVFTGSGAR